MDNLEKDHIIKSNSRTNITKNTLVVIHKNDIDPSLLNEENPFSTNISHFTIGNPDTVPAGVYAKEALTELGKLEALKSKLVFGKDVIQVLTFVETGNAEMGIVFASDAKSSDKVEVNLEIDSTLHSPIVYPGAIVFATKHPDAARTFLDYLKTSKVQEVLAEYGFSN